MGYYIRWRRTFKDIRNSTRCLFKGHFQYLSDSNHDRSHVQYHARHGIVSLSQSSAGLFHYVQNSTRSWIFVVLKTYFLLLSLDLQYLIIFSCAMQKRRLCAVSFRSLAANTLACKRYCRTSGESDQPLWLWHKHHQKRMEYFKYMICNLEAWRIATPTIQSCIKMRHT